MKKFRLFAYAALAMTGLSMVSCSEEDKTVYATPGSFGELTIDRTTIGTHQWFTISGSYTHGKDVANEDLTISIDGGLPSTLKLSEDNKFSVEMAVTKSGTHEVTVSATNIGIFHDGEVQQKVEKSIDVNVVASDIRCHFWGDSRETTIENLKYYTTLNQSDPSFLSITEQDMYGTVSYAKEVSATESLRSYGNRVVMYKFDTNNKLNAIQYYCIPKAQQIESYIWSVAIRMLELKNEYNFEPYFYYNPNDNTTTGSNLTAEEKAAADACLEKLNSGATADFDTDGKVGSLIQNNKVAFASKFSSKDEKTKGFIATNYSNNEYHVMIQFEPAN